MKSNKQLKYSNYVVFNHFHGIVVNNSGKCLDYGVSINLRNKHLYKTCGLRVGTQEISRYGWQDTEMLFIAKILRDIRNNNEFSQDISDRINKLSTDKKIFYTIENDCYDIIYTQLHHS